jgi:lipopolysaccharide export system permease protein
VLPGLVGIYLLIEVFERLDDFIEAHASMSSALAYFLLSIPKIFYELTPLAVLLAGLLSIMLISKHMELLAMRSLGVKPWKILWPLILTAFFLSIILITLKCLYIPRATEKAQAIFQLEVKKKPPRGMLKGNKLFFLGEKSIWATELGSPDARILKNVQWFSFDSDYKIKQFVTATEAIYSGNKWIFKHGLQKIRIENEEEPAYSVKVFESLDLKLAEAPEDFVAVEMPPAQMDTITLWKNIHRLKQSGYPANEQETVLWAQILYPLLGCSLLLVGLIISMFREQGGLGMGLGLGLIIGFMAWIAWSLVLTLGKTGKVPPFLAPCMVHLVLIIIGFALMRRLRF